MEPTLLSPYSGGRAGSFAPETPYSFSGGGSVLGSPGGGGRLLLEGQWVTTPGGGKQLSLEKKHAKARKNGWSDALDRIAKSKLKPEEAPGYVESYVAAVELQARTRGMLARTRARNLQEEKRVAERALINTGVVGARRNAAHNSPLFSCAFLCDSPAARRCHHHSYLLTAYPYA